MADTTTLTGDFSPFFAAYPAPMMLFDRNDFRIVDVNEAALREYGWTRDEFLRRTVLDLRPPEDEPAFRARVALPAEELNRTRGGRHRRKDGTVLDVEVTVSDLVLSGRSVRLALVRDVTEARWAEVAQRALAHAGAVLARSLDLEATLDEVARLIVPELADYVQVHLLGDDDMLRQWVVAHRDPERDRLLRESGPLIARELTCPVSAISRVARSGQAELIEQARGDGLISGHGGETLARINRRLAPTCFVLAPLVGRERSIGVLTLAQAESGRRFGPRDVDLVAELGRRAGMALENAQLYRAGREANERYRALFDQSMDGVCVYDAHGRFLEVNEAAAAKLLCSPEEARRLCLADIVIEEQHDSLAESLGALAEGVPGRMVHEYGIRRRDGSRLTVEVRSAPVRRDGVPYAFVALVRDITERRRAERALRESEARFRALFESAPAGVALLDGAGRITALNGPARALLGPDAREGIEALALLEPTDADRERLLLGELLAGRIERYTLDVRLARSNERLLSASMYAAHPNEGGEAFLVRTMEDVTERRRAEEAASRLAIVAESVQEAIFSSDCEGTITSWNAGAERIFGHTTAEMLGRAFTILVRPAGRDAAEEVRRRVVAGEVVHFATVVGAEATTHISMTLSPVRDRSGRIVGVGAVAYDETERLALEARLLEAEKMEAIGRLAGGVAHDFNNILTGVKGHCAFLLDTVSRVDPRRAELEEIDRAADRAAALTRQLLAFGRRQVLQPRDLRLSTAVAEMEAMLRRLIGEHIQLVTRPQPDGGTIRADPGQLQQVILNLAVNARDAMPDGGRLLIETGHTLLDGTGPEGIAPGRYSTLAVEDSGHGIDAEALPHIFEPFFTTRAPGSGTGLGLATVYGIVRQSGGAVTVDTRPGRTRFCILLPESDAAVREDPRPDPPPTPPDRGSETILLVEDEAPVREIAGRTLREAGYTVLPARTGADALALAHTFPGTIHLLLSDVVLPDTPGPAVARELARIRPGVRILFVSGYARDLVLGESGTEGAFLEKPFAPPELRSKVRAVLDA